MPNTLGFLENKQKKKLDESSGSPKEVQPMKNGSRSQIALMLRQPLNISDWMHFLILTAFITVLNQSDVLPPAVFVFLDFVAVTTFITSSTVSVFLFYGS